MASKLEVNDDDSFIILGTSPGTSLDLKCNGIENGVASLDKIQLDDALKDLPPEASMAFKAHFKLGDCPSPASLMVASSIITDDKSTEELQKRFGELLDENVILKETLKQNNESMKEQFLLIASCQEDMMKTHVIHKEKFDETRELVEKLRQENKRLKTDLVRLTDLESASSDPDPKSGPSSALEFVTSPEDDTVNKLTDQLGLVEKQRRQVIVENEKLTWQKESLEHIVDATSKERDELREKLKKSEMQLSMASCEFECKIESQNSTIQDLQMKLQTASMTSISSDEVTKRDVVIQQLEGKVSALQNDLKTAQLKILELENVKLEFSKHKSGVADTIKLYKDQLHDLNNRLKEAQTTVFQPVRLSISSEPDASNSEYASFISNVKLYDKTLKHLSDLLNLVTHGSSDSIVQTLGAVASLHDYKLDRCSAEQFKSGLAEVKQQLERQHSTALSNLGQVRSTLTIFEGIFKDYNDLLKKSLTKQQNKQPAANVEALTAALVARGQELQALEAEVNTLRNDREDKELLRAQLDLYKSDFEAEREAREKMASDKETVLSDLRGAQRRILELTQQLEEVRKLNPNIYRSATAPAPAPAPAGPRARSSGPAPPPPSARRPPAPATSTGNMSESRRSTKTKRARKPMNESANAGPRDYEIDDDCVVM